MPVSQSDIIALSSPIPVPTEMGDFRPQDKSAFTSKQQEVNAALSGVSKDPGVGLPFGDTGLIEKSGASTSTGTTTTDFAGPIDVVGEKVGGLVGRAPQDPDKYEAYIPEPKDEIAEDTDEFVEAEKGFQRTNKEGELIGKEQSGRRGARKAKRQDRKEDRWLRKGYTKQEDGSWEKTRDKLKGSDKRKKRRLQRQNRKQSWQNYKGEMDLQAQDELAELENY